MFRKSYYWRFHQRWVKDSITLTLVQLFNNLKPLSKHMSKSKTTGQKRRKITSLCCRDQGSNQGNQERGRSPGGWINSATLESLGCYCSGSDEQLFDSCPRSASKFRCNACGKPGHNKKSMEIAKPLVQRLSKHEQFSIQLPMSTCSYNPRLKRLVFEAGARRTGVKFNSLSLLDTGCSINLMSIKKGLNKWKV